jgi:hypothetical protein
LEQAQVTHNDAITLQKCSEEKKKEEMRAIMEELWLDYGRRRWIFPCGCSDSRLISPLGAQGVSMELVFC